MKGERYKFDHNIMKHYEMYTACGWEEIEALELMSGTLTDWESSSRYKESFYATVKQLNKAVEIYTELEQRLIEYLAIKPI